MCRSFRLFPVALMTAAVVPAEAQSPAGEWRHFGADAAFTRYSPLDRINHENVGELEIAWRRPAADPELQAAFPDLGISAYLRSTPILVDGVLYAPNAQGLLEAFDPATGETLWRQPPFAATAAEVAGGSTRGAAYWTDGTDRRLLLVRGGYLYALDARTGRRVASFGLADQGRVDLDWEHPLAGEFDWTAGPIVVGDVVVVAGITGGSRVTAASCGRRRRRTSAASTCGPASCAGRSTSSRAPGELGADTWGDGSGAYSGDLGSWCCLAADEELGSRLRPALGADRAWSTAGTGRGTTSSRTPSSRSTPRPASGSGTSRWCTTMSGSTTRWDRRPWARSRSTAGASGP